MLLGDWADMRCRIKDIREKVQEADFDVACKARLFLGGHVSRYALQDALDKQAAAYAAWDGALDGNLAAHDAGGKRCRGCLTPCEDPFVS